MASYVVMGVPKWLSTKQQKWTGHPVNNEALNWIQMYYAPPRDGTGAKLKRGECHYHHRSIRRRHVKKPCTGCPTLHITCLCSHLLITNFDHAPIGIRESRFSAHFPGPNVNPAPPDYVCPVLEVDSKLAVADTPPRQPSLPRLAAMAVILHAVLSFNKGIPNDNLHSLYGIYKCTSQQKTRPESIYSTHAPNSACFRCPGCSGSAACPML